MTRAHLFRLRAAPSANTRLCTPFGSSVDFAPRFFVSSPSLPGSDFYLTKDGAKFVRETLFVGVDDDEGYLVVRFGIGASEVLYGGPIRYLTVAFLGRPTPAQLVEALSEESC